LHRASRFPSDFLVLGSQRFLFNMNTPWLRDIPLSNVSPPLDNPESEVGDAFDLCLATESRLDKNDASTEVKNLNLIRIRVLGYLLLYDPTPTAACHIAGSINSAINASASDATNDLALINLGDFYEKRLIRPCECSQFEEMSA